MTISARHFACLTAIGLLSACAQRERVSLSVDFTARDEWHYDFALTVGGRVSLGDSVSSFGNTMRCRLVGRGDTTDPTLVHATTRDVSLESALLREDEAADVRRRLEVFDISYSLRDGFAGLPDSTPVPVVGAGHGELYRHFFKMMPLLPDGRVRPGFSWEREKKLPIPTKHGDAIGHVYRSFTFDSLRRAENGHRLAYLSWSLSYALDPQDVDTSGFLDDMPRKGKGAGSAVLDVDDKALLRARVEFTVPQGGQEGVFSIDWQEHASIVLVDAEQERAAGDVE
ncbi:MAG: hypothetical protein GF418_07540 [Chitinivibrionales bacterium]|nr:hypothetical protein [Chitinivibrionales bacterium]MBD3395465.1 hypothetical protein [Chitinivibrionales bacterium]